MKIIEAIIKADLTAPNDIEQETKVGWLSTVDGLISREILNTHCGTEVEFDGYDEDTDLEETDLLAPWPYDELYVDYLVMRTHLVHQEIERYNNAALVYAESLRRLEGYINKRYPHKTVRALRF